MFLDRWFNYDKKFKQNIITELTNLKNKLTQQQQTIYNIYLAELQVKDDYNYYSPLLEENSSKPPIIYTLAKSFT